MPKQVLMIATSHAQLGSSGKATGVWAEELAVPWNAFVDAGYRVVLASPLSGPVPIDPGSVKPAGQNGAAVERWLSDTSAQAQAAASQLVASVNGAEFDAVFLPGGHGTMWDLPTDPGVIRAVEAAFAANKVVASVCHGAAGLVGARRPDGLPLVAGKRVNSFTDAEEDAVGLSTVVPFALEARLRAQGGLFEGAANWQPFAVRDGRLVTGQNPQSSALVVQQVLEALAVVSPA